MDVSLLHGTHQHVSPTHVTIFRVARTRIQISLICEKSVTTQNLVFLNYWYCTERNVCRCTFNRYSVITQFAKLAAGEQLCVFVALTENYSTLKSLKVLLKNHNF